MNWVKRFNEAINYIEEHLDGDISYETISNKVGCSIYNFQRMFSYIADKPLSEYIRSRRLTSAAFDILNCDDRLIDISIKYGYKSQDAFTRAFKKFHGVLPSDIRNETVKLKSCPKISFQMTIKGVNHMNYQIEDFPAFKVIGVSKRIDTKKAFNIVPKIWEEAWKDGTIHQLMDIFKQADYRPAGFLGLSSGGQWGNSEEMEYILAVTSYVDTPECQLISPNEGLEQFSYPASKWAIFEANGEPPQAVQKIYKQFYTEWLPNSGYQLKDLPVIECYMQNNRQEVWIALENDSNSERR